MNDTSISLNFQKLGSSGPAIVLVHGWAHSLESFRPLGELLADQMQVYLVDLPGFGDSPPPGEGWGTPEYAEALRAFLDSQGIEKPILIGHSFGGQVAIRLASAHPQRLSKIVLIGSAGLRRERTPAEKRRFRLIAIARDTIKLIDRTFGSKLYESFFIPRFGSEDYVKAGPLRPVLVKAVNEDLSEEASKISLPVLLMWGERDTASPIANGRRLNTLIAGSNLIELPGRGHTPFLGTGAHLCLYHLRQFLGLNQAEPRHA